MLRWERDRLSETVVRANRVKSAFDEFRAPPQIARLPRGTKPGDLTVQMTPADGLTELTEGGTAPEAIATTASLPPGWEKLGTRLWVVRLDDVVHAPEKCPFGTAREKGVVKHTNLTGGACAYAAGEIVFTGSSQAVVTGFSGRYPTRPLTAMAAVEQAFMRSGYDVWTTGWDTDAGRAVPLGTRPPYRVVGE